MSEASYSALAPHATTMTSVTSNFGSTATPAALQHIFGPQWIQTLLGYQAPGESCVYYVDSDKPTTTVFQLCFNRTNVLATKSIIPPSSG